MEECKSGSWAILKSQIKTTSPNTFESKEFDLVYEKEENCKFAPCIIEIYKNSNPFKRIEERPPMLKSN